jgi:hypothetical protein
MEERVRQMTNLPELPDEEEEQTLVTEGNGISDHAEKTATRRPRARKGT